MDIYGVSSRATAAVPSQPSRAGSQSTFAGVLAQAHGSHLMDPDLAPPVRDTEGQLRWAAQQLEAFFTRELFTSMRRTVPEGGLFKKSFASEMYEDMLWDERAKAAVAAGGLGLSELILSQLRG